MPKSRVIKVKLEPNRPEAQSVARPLVKHKKSYPSSQKLNKVKS